MALGLYTAVYLSPVMKKKKKKNVTCIMDKVSYSLFTTREPKIMQWANRQTQLARGASR